MLIAVPAIYRRCPIMCIHTMVVLEVHYIQSKVEKGRLLWSFHSKTTLGRFQLVKVCRRKKETLFFLKKSYYLCICICYLYILNFRSKCQSKLSGSQNMAYFLHFLHLFLKNISYIWIICGFSISACQDKNYVLIQ